MGRSFDKWFAIGLGLVGVLLAVNVGVAYRNTLQLHADGYSVAHTHAALDALDDLLSTLKDAETGQRGFLITGEDAYLKPYETAAAAVYREVAVVKRLTEDNLGQQARIPRLLELVRSKMDELASTIALRKTAGFDVAQKEVLTHVGKNRMDAIRDFVGGMQRDERRLLEERQAANDSAYAAARASGAFVALVGLVAVLSFVWILRRHLAARLQAAALLYEQQERFRTTLASIGDAVIATDTEGRVTYLNRVAQVLTGWSDDEAKGQPLETVFRIVNEQSRNAVENPALRALKEGRIVGLANHTVLISRGGKETPIDDSAAPIQDRDQRVVGAVLVFRDISARKREEADRQERVRQLADAEERNRSVVDTVVDGIITIDESAVVQSFNPAAERLFGYQAADIVGQNVKMLMPDPYRGEHDGYVANYVRTGEARIIGIGREVNGRRKDGSTFPMELAVSEFRLDQRRYFTGIVRDITERKRTEREMYGLLIDLKEADRRKDEFLATLAHELRGPLAPLSNTLEIIKRADGDGESIRQARSTMERQLGQMVRLVDDLLDVSRITRNRLELRKERVDLALVVNQAVEICRPLAESSMHELRVTLPAEPIYLNGDAVRLTQVLSNLLNNSCRYTGSRGKILLTVTREGRDAVVSVKDNGIGIPREMLPHVFEMFMQVDRSLERTQGGLGIGLTLVKQLAELHGGSVEALSDGPGRGSEFVVRLPALIDGTEHHRPAETAAAVSTRARRILVVDDNRDSAVSLATLLQIAGHETCSAYDGLDALEAAARFRPEVILLDIGLPKLNGYDAARRIREQPWGKGVVLVALTGWGQDADRRRSREAGFDEHMVKPVDHAALTKLLASLPARDDGRPQ